MGGWGVSLENHVKSRIKAHVARVRAEARADPPIDPHMRLKKQVAEVSYLMALIHGGDWRVQIEPEKGIVLIARRL